MTDRTHRAKIGLTCILLLCLSPVCLLAAECLSESYTLLQGREVVEPLRTREIGESEYEDLKTFLEELEGDWKGTIAELTCKGGPGDERNEVVEYTVKARGTINSSGKFVLKSNLASREKKVKRQDNLTLYLSEKYLATVLLHSGSDIEIAWASADKLIYVRKIRDKKQAGNRNFIAHEWVTAIEKVDESTVRIEKAYYRQGRLLSHSSWHLEAD